jgi:ADP-ribose pyrophosphatase YjhB (NUDIX family)
VFSFTPTFYATIEIPTTMNSHHATAVLIVCKEGTPLVRDPKKPIIRYWKLPGGRSERNETAEECAIREIQEELGLTIKKEDLTIVDQQDKGTHTLTLFTTELPSLDGLNKIGNEQEEIEVFKLSEIAEMPDFFPNHKNIVQKIARLYQ